MHSHVWEFEGLYTGADIKVGAENVWEKKKVCVKPVCVGVDEDYSELCHL